MINSSPSKNVKKNEVSREKALSSMYERIVKEYEGQIIKGKNTSSNQDFDDAVLSNKRKILPSLQHQSNNQVKRKFYSKKLILNETLYKNERKQKSIHEVMSDFKKLTIPSPFKNQGTLSERNRRIKELYDRVQKNVQSPDNKLKFSKPIQNPNKCDDFEQISPQLSQVYVRIGEKRSKSNLRQVKQRRQKLQLPNLRGQRSKSTIIIPQITTEDENNPQNNLKCTKIQSKTLQPHKSLKNKRNQRIQRIYQRSIESVGSHKKIVKNTQEFIAKIKNVSFNWKKQIIPLNKIDKEVFCNLIRFYNDIGPIKPIQSGFYKAYIGPGNNQTIIKKALKDRGYWMIVQNINENPHFVWTQLRAKNFSNKINECPTVQSQQNVKTTNNLLDIDELQRNTNLIEFLKIKKNDFFQACERLLQKNVYLNISNAIMGKFKRNQNVKHYNKLRPQILQNYQKIEQKNNEVSIEAEQIKLHNHVKDAGCIGDKKGLLEMLKKYAQIFQSQINELIPKTLHIKESDNIEQVIGELDEGAWILKPGQATNRGTGITVHTSKQSLLNQLSKKKKHKNGIKYTHILQKYVQPLLYFNRKFDIRVWVLWNGQQAWWYQEGYIRTASKQFTMKSTNKYVHLTNDAIQCQCDQYGKHEPANKVSFNQFAKYLQSQYNYKNFNAITVPTMKQLAKITFQTANLVLKKKRQHHSFQLFGLDFLLDNKFKPWIIQCNTNPCLQINCSLLARLIPNMINNVLNLTADVLFPAPARKKIKDEAWNQDSFKFQLLYDGRQDTQILQNMKGKRVNIDYKGEYQQQFIQE